MIKTVLMLTVLDFITGVLASLYEGKTNSHTGFKGIIKKFQIYIIIASTVVLNNVIGIDVPLREMVITFYIVNEGLSILENGGKMVTYPDFLKNKLEQLRGDEK